ncbi:MAG: response regulator [bacterium]|nr:response regulator [bacterium]
MTRKMILLIDNNIGHHEKFLGDMKEKYEIISAYSYEEAVSLFELIKDQVKVVLLSADVKGMDTIDLLEKMKQIGVFSEFIIFSNNEDIDLAVEVMKKGAYSYMILPFEAKVLKYTIDNIFEGLDMLKQIENYTKISFLSKFSDSRKLRYLEELLKKRRGEGRIVSTDELMQLLNGDDDDIEALFENPGGYKEFLKNEIESPRILVIEDEEYARLMIKAILEEKYEVHVAGDGQTAVNILKNQKDIDVVLLDIYLPDTNGVDLLPKIKLINPEVEVVIVTAYKDIDVVIKTLKNGASDYINKPYRKVDLCSTLTRVLQLRYLKQFLPEFNKQFLQKNVSYSSKLEMLTDLIKQRKKNGEDFKMSDIYIFFPELRKTNIDENKSLKSNLDAEGLMAFIYCLQAKIDL